MGSFVPPTTMGGGLTRWLTTVDGRILGSYELRRRPSRTRERKIAKTREKGRKAKIKKKEKKGFVHEGNDAVLSI